ncbi:FAD-dependent monooxygenase [Streptomyces coffeae]|nr:FAD-dependent monooxygenase [Streptomyces coffeae]
MTNLLGGEALAVRSRSPEIMADAALAILVRPPHERTGRTFIDADVLATGGLTDLNRYGGGDHPEPDLFVDSPRRVTPTHELLSTRHGSRDRRRTLALPASSRSPPRLLATPADREQRADCAHPAEATVILNAPAVRSVEATGACPAVPPPWKRVTGRKIIGRVQSLTQDDAVMKSPMMRNTEFTPVVIAGGGAVGITLSLMLARRGVSTVVLERELHPQTLPRAQR